MTQLKNLITLDPKSLKSQSVSLSCTKYLFYVLLTKFDQILVPFLFRMTNVPSIFTNLYRIQFQQKYEIFLLMTIDF